MPDLADLQSELEAIETAYYAGTRVVSYEGKRVEYDDEAGMRRRMAYLKAKIALASGRPHPVAGFATFRRAR